MTTTMAVAFFVLVLTLVVITEAEESDDDANKAAQDFCATKCADKKDSSINSNCKESCVLSQRADLASLENVACLGKCTQYDNIPDMKSCDEGCKKEYNAKAAEITSSCNAVCSKVEDSHHIEACKKECTPSSS